MTSLVPSGKVASTWMSGIISAMPSMTSSRDSTVLPSLISAATPHWHAGDAWGVFVVIALTAAAAWLDRRGR